MTKTSQDNNLNYIHFLKHFYEYHTKKLKYRDVTCLISKLLPWQICYYCFCSNIQSLLELASVIGATAPYFEHTALLLILFVSLVSFQIDCSKSGLNLCDKNTSYIFFVYNQQPITSTFVLLHCGTKVQ